MHLSQEVVSLESVGGKLQTLQKLHKEICAFILAHNTNRQFDTALVHIDNFSFHIQRLLKEKQMLVFRNIDRKMIGVCGWALIDDKKGVNKLKWTLPNNITSGRILYITVAALDEGADILMIKKFFDTNGFRSKVDSVFWGNFNKNKMYNVEVKK